jgi:hypothetical protein
MHSKTVALFLSLGLTSTLTSCAIPTNQGKEVPPPSSNPSPNYQKSTPDAPATNSKGKDNKSKESGEGGESGT